MQESPTCYLAENDICQKERKLAKFSQVASGFHCVVNYCSSIIVVKDNTKFKNYNLMKLQLLYII